MDPPRWKRRIGVHCVGLLTSTKKQERQIQRWMEAVDGQLTFIDEEIGKVLTSGHGFGRVRDGSLAPLVNILLRMELNAPDGVILGFDAGDESQSVIVLRRGGDVVEAVQTGGGEVVRC